MDYVIDKGNRGIPGFDLYNRNFAAAKSRTGDHSEPSWQAN
jgi:hypothetical protein